MIQVWVNKDEAANATELAAKLNALVKERANGAVLSNDKLIDPLRGFVLFMDQARKDEAAKMAAANKIEHVAVAYMPAAKRDEAAEGHGIPTKAKNVVYVINDSIVTAVFLDLQPADFDKVIKALEATLKAREDAKKAAAEAEK